MSIRSILVPLTSNTERQSVALEAAIALASHRRAYLDVLYMKAEPALAFRTLPSVNVAAGSVIEPYRLLRQQIEDDCNAMHGTFVKLCERYGVRAADAAETPGSAPTAGWIEVDMVHQSTLSRHGRLADLIVVGRADPEGDRALLEMALRSTGRPVLMVPAWNGTLPGHKIAIAWNGSAEATRALGAVLPFLEVARSVTILTAQSDRTAAAVAEGARTYLARHDIKAEALVFEKSIDPPVGKALLEHCRRLEADMLVMGAYTHSRAHELLLGGVTSYMAAHADRSVFMMH